jgi:ActR/RegA family two-component response regulator
MPEPDTTRLQGRRLLVVEDDYFIAAELARSLERMGAEVVGPAGSVADALGLIESGEHPFDGAVLDIHLGDERVYPVADALAARRVPFVFLTGYDAVVIPEAYADATRCEKPVDTALLMRVLDEAKPIAPSGDARQTRRGA